MIPSTFETTLATLSDIPVYLAAASFLLAFTIFVFLIIHQQFKGLYRLWDERFAERDEDLLMQLIATGNVSLLAKLNRSQSTRDLIIRIASKLQGEAVHQLIGAYNYLGFAMDDFHQLAHSNIVRRMQALQRCRTLKLPLPNEAWTKLLEHPNQTYRWAAMEYLILVKAKDSLLWLLAFLQLPFNQETGMALHLSCCFAKTSPQTTQSLATGSLR
ncbi:MAG: hypothetical protein H7249_02480 [Chitinophagaceae bacterium]|nr:hypothetical protein [Oligoflexus sp.]